MGSSGPSPPSPPLAVRDDSGCGCGVAVPSAAAAAATSPASGDVAWRTRAPAWHSSGRLLPGATSWTSVGGGGDGAPRLLPVSGSMADVWRCAFWLAGVLWRWVECVSVRCGAVWVWGWATEGAESCSPDLCSALGASARCHGRMERTDAAVQCCKASIPGKDITRNDL